MTTVTRFDDSIAPIVEEALKAGFHVYALKGERRPVGFVFVALDPNGPFAAVNSPTHPWEDASLSAKIKPSKDYGSAVLADYDGTVSGAIETLRTVCSEPNVTVRFVAKRGQAAPVVPNYGNKVLISWPGGADRFEDLKTAGN